MNQQIDQILINCKSVALIGHINPDGDCFGSLSAVNDYITSKFNCVVHCFAECCTVAEEFEPFVKDIDFNPEPLNNYDVCVCLDTGDLCRLGKYIDIFNSSKFTICIDHHATNNGFAQLNIINVISSNCEHIHSLLIQNGFEIPKSTAGKLFAGIITDTNNLSTDTVTSNTYRTIASLQDKGINSYRIRRFFFGGNSIPQFKLLAFAMNGAQFYNNDTIMVMKITKEQLQATNATQEDLNPIINQAFCMKHALSAILITPRNGQTHVSFRGREGINVSIIAQHFGGGGHKAASAFTAPVFTEQDLEYIINNLTNQINNLPKNNNELF